MVAALPVVAAVTACAVVIAAERHDPAPGEPVPTAVSPAHPTSPAPDPPPATGSSHARVVQPGRPFSIGAGRRMKLEPSQRCFQDRDAAWICEDVMTRNQPVSTVSSQNLGSQHATVYAPLYVGPGLPTRMTVTVEGHTYAAQVVSLAGHPGYAVGYTAGPPPHHPGSFPELKIMVYDATGHVLASLISPASSPSS